MTEKHYLRKTMIQANTQNQTSNFGNVELQYLPPP